MFQNFQFLEPVLLRTSIFFSFRYVGRVFLRNSGLSDGRDYQNEKSPVHTSIRVSLSGSGYTRVSIQTPAREYERKYMCTCAFVCTYITLVYTAIPTKPPLRRVAVRPLCKPTPLHPSRSPATLDNLPRRFHLLPSWCPNCATPGS